MDVAVYGSPCLCYRQLRTWEPPHGEGPRPTGSSIRHFLTFMETPTLSSQETSSSPQWGCIRLLTPYKETINGYKVKKQTNQESSFVPVNHFLCMFVQPLTFIPFLNQSLYYMVIVTWHPLQSPELKRLEAKNYISQTPLQLGFWMDANLISPMRWHSLNKVRQSPPPTSWADAAIAMVGFLCSKTPVLSGSFMGVGREMQQKVHPESLFSSSHWLHGNQEALERW